MRAKYVRTQNDEIIVFTPSLAHSSFRHFNPISAGFISFGINSGGNPTCTCYGESISLGLNSMEDDTRLAQFQLGLRDY